MLRGYQQDMVERICSALQGQRSVMAQMPTGTGKTLVLAAVVEEFLSRRQETEGPGVLVVAHRRQLVEQIGEMVDRALAHRKGGLRGCIGIHSIQWLHRHLDEVAGEPQLVVIDEAHHALAATYRMLWERWPKAAFLGLTATPYRMNGEGFTELFEGLVRSWSVKRFIAEGWLAGYVYYSIRPDSEVQGVIDSLKKRGADGDYQTKEMREKLDRMPTLRGLYEAYRQRAAGRKGLVYAIDIEHAEHIAAFYREQGVAAEAVSSKTSREVRLEAVRRLKVGTLEVLVNVDLFSEGFDCPEVGFIQLARPTLSLARYLQMVGRGLRPSQEKGACVLLDHVGLYRVFGLPSDDRDWEGFFQGVSERQREVLLTGGCLGGGWFPPRLLEETDGEVVEIASVVSGEPGSWSGSEGVRPGVDYGSIRLTTEDGVLFFPQGRSPYLKGVPGIHRKVLETQVYGGISWQRLYIPFERPEEVYRLQEVVAGQGRVYLDDEDRLWAQEDLDHPLRRLEEWGGMEAFHRWMEAEVARDRQRVAQRYLNKVMNPGEKVPEGAFPVGTVYVPVGEELLEVRAASGEPLGWLDLKTGYRHREKPVLFQRGFVSLLREGNRVFVRNIPQEAGIAYRNWEIRCDEEICTVGNGLYFAQGLWAAPYRIKKRSEDFRMFLLEPNLLHANYERGQEELMVINQPGKPLELKWVAAQSSTKGR